MTKREGIICALGEVRGFLECEKDYETVNLGELLGNKYKRYELGLSNGINSIAIYDTEIEWSNSLRRRVIEIDKEIYFEDLVNILLQALAFELRLHKK